MTIYDVTKRHWITRMMGFNIITVYIVVFILCTYIFYYDSLRTIAVI